MVVDVVAGVVVVVTGFFVDVVVVRGVVVATASAPEVTVDLYITVKSATVPGV